jgi:hypothetical protein
MMPMAKLIHAMRTQTQLNADGAKLKKYLSSLMANGVALSVRVRCYDPSNI